MALALTDRQKQVLGFIRVYQQDTGLPPTRAEIAQGLGFRSANAAEEHLKALQKKGAIEILPGRSRGLRLVQAEPLGIPIIGQVAAGAPILAEPHIQDRLNIPTKMFHPAADYALRVKGLSMKNAGIFDGDLLLVHHAHTAQNGQIIVARIDQEVTVKRFKKTKRGVELIPENPDFDILLITPDQQDFHIEGIGVGVIRQGL